MELARDQWEALVTAAIELDLIGGAQSDGTVDDAKDAYTGRGMIVGEDADTCIAFVIDSDDDILNFGHHLERLLFKAELDDLDAELFTRNCRSDSHGQRTVLYFPRISVEQRWRKP